MLVMTSGGYAQLLKDERQRQGISQTEMAEKLGVSRRWLIEFEHGRVPNPGFATILSMLSALGLSLDVRKTPHPTDPYEW
ncbi:helix-turn-helix transcriptional regulator [Bifidobacterium sp. SO4]|uniref:helix-turn-helix domain-containing protein n=1 Tax=Bifidobacterium sp. SO4 TaxID=2809030 RepID=UPI001BDC3B09|nr:helix-turn-helix transcriptional regulator [Bifidobacterium sp. SO4]MBT1171650.1 helix-turn-helix transcriptional regulator [Bifidobacterium sp. SO4]